MARKCEWTGASGKKYMYDIYLIGTNWNDVPGNYIFAKEASSSNWESVYIGETESFKDRLPNHNELPCVSRNGGTHIHVRINRDSNARLEEERDLIDHNNPSCND